MFITQFLFPELSEVNISTNCAGTLMQKLKKCGSHIASNNKRKSFCKPHVTVDLQTVSCILTGVSTWQVKAPNKGEDEQRVLLPSGKTSTLTNANTSTRLEL